MKPISTLYQMECLYNIKILTSIIACKARNKQEGPFIRHSCMY